MPGEEMRVKRRTFLRTLSRAAVCLPAASALSGLAALVPRAARADRDISLFPAPQPGPYDLNIRDYYTKMRHFDSPSEGDIVLNAEDHALLLSSLARMERLIAVVGHANFCLLGFDEALQYARNYSSIGAFTPAELEFLECQYYADAAVYGFYGIKTIPRLTDTLPQADAVKVPYSGNFLFAGHPHRTWLTIHKALGDSVVLTSGVRGVMKQFHLFLSKAAQSNGNLSLASRSLAPPGYSFHGVGDFDVGQQGYGEANFTSRFTETEVFRRLEDMGYLTLRYPRENRLGVRFEPWHVKVNQA